MRQDRGIHIGLGEFSSNLARFTIALGLSLALLLGLSPASASDPPCSPGEIYNVASISGDEPDPTPDNDTSEVCNPIATANPSLTIDKSASPISYSAVGEVINYSFLVTNTGNVTVNNLAVADDKATDENCPVTTLAPGATATCFATYTIIQDDLDAGSVTNIATASATDPDNNPVTSPPDTETVDALTDLLIGDRVWFDTNQDGVQDPDEPGIAGVAVRLIGTDVIGNPVDEIVYTDGSGFYAFEDLIGGTYSVTFDSDGALMAADYDVTIQDADPVSSPLADSFDSDADTNGVVAGVTVTGKDVTIDAGFYLANGDLPARISDTVWYDTDGNGIQDNGEPGVSGVVVELYDATGTELLATDVTDGAGQYEFAGLPVGEYTVKFNAPAGYTISPQYADGATTPADSAVDSDADPTTGLTDAFVVLAGIDLTQVDAGMRVAGADPASIGDFVWYDTNSNGIQDTDEPGIPGIVVNIYPDADQNGQPDTVDPLSTEITGLSGDYTFDGLNANSYVLEFVTPDSYTLTLQSAGGDSAVDSDADPLTGFTNTIDIATGETIDEIDAGMFVPGQAPISIGDFVFTDLNENGQPDNGESLEDVEVVLYDALGNELGRTTTVASTDSSNYAFTGVAASLDYRVAVDTSTLPVGAIQVFDPDAVLDDTTDVIAPTADVDTADFGYESLALPRNTVIGNRVWLDEDGDGVQDAGEAGIPNLNVELYLAGDDPDTTSPQQTTTTDADGGYLFAVAPGDYQVVVVPSAGLQPTYDEDGIGTPNVSDNISVADGDEHLTADFGYNWVDPDNSTDPQPQAPGAIGDRIWNDADGDGVQDPGEAGIDGVQVTLFYDPDANGIYDSIFPGGTTTTDAAGNYIFDDLPPDSYVVAVTPPTGYDSAPTGFPVGGEDSVSDPILLAPGDVYVNADYGYQLSAGGSDIGDTIYVDANANGVEDIDELGIRGVSVALYDDLNGNGTVDPGEPVIATTVTDENGNYLFPGLPGTSQGASGDYVVVITDTDNVLGERDQTADPDGGNDGQSGLQDISGLPGGSNLDQDHGYAPIGHQPGDGYIGDTIFIDGNASLAFEAGEGVEGVVVELYNTAGTDLLATTFTDENGNYGFGGLDPTAAYLVRVDTNSLPSSGASLTNSVDPDGVPDSQAIRDLNDLSVGPIDQAADFGYLSFGEDGGGRILGNIWNDTDANGTLDDDESNDGIPGITVDIYEDVNANGVLDAGDRLVGRTLTDETGEFTFGELPPGNYLVDVTDEAGLLAGYWKSDGPNDGANNNSQIDPYPIALSPNEVNDTADFGYYIEAAALGNRVWLDDNGDEIADATDGNGIQDAGEPGLEGIEVTLTISYPNGDNVELVTLSDANGFYSFANLLLDEDYTAGNGGAGEPTYVISAQTGGITPEIGVTGYVPTVINAGTDTKLDSDNHAGVTPLVAQGDNDLTVDAANPGNESVEASYDFGYRIVPFGEGLVNGTVYIDSNGDGQLDPSDTVLAGVEVAITDVNGVVTTVTTDANGYFEQQVPSGTTTVDVIDATLPDGASLTSDANGEGNDPTTVTVPNGGIATDNTGYLLEPGTGLVEGIVYTDEDGNGFYDPAIDTPLEGVDVLITDADGTTTVVTTDENGTYSAVVPAGETVVDVDDSDLPAGSVLTTDANGQGSDPTTVNVPDGGSARDDTGYVDGVDTGSVSERVYLENNGTPGYQDGIDTPLPGVTVVITASNDAVYSLTTDSEGLVTQLVPIGDTVIDIDDASLPTGTIIDSVELGVGFTSTDPTTVDVPLNGTALDTTGYVLTGGNGIVDGTVYLDNDGDGSYDPGVDTPLGGVEVTITDVNGTETVVVTDANGYYSQSVPPGATTVDVNDADLPADATLTDNSNGEGNDPSVVTVVAGETVTDNTGYVLPPTASVIGNRVWLDENGDGVQDAGEAGIANLSVELYLAGVDPNTTTPLASTVTDADGGYLFAVEPGAYQVVVVPTAGLEPTFDEDGIATPNVSDNINIAAGEEHLSTDFGYNWVDPQASDDPGPNEPGAIGDRIWNDADGDGIQDPGESGLGGVEVSLLTDDNGDGIYGGVGDDPASTVTTAPDGSYIFDDLPPAGYVVAVNPATLPAGFNTAPSGFPAGGADGVSDPILLAPGDVYVNADYGYKLDTDNDPTTPDDPAGGSDIGDQIYLDSDRDGTTNGDTEPGIAGVTVALIDDASGDIIATTVSSDGTVDVDGDGTIDPVGSYVFPGLPGTDQGAAGTYTVVVTDTDNVLGSREQTGDPDVGTPDGQSSVIVDGTTDIDTVDFGYAPLDQGLGSGYIGDTIFLDTGDGLGGTPDGVFQAGEGLEGVLVELYESDGTTLVATTTTDENGLYGFAGLDQTATYVVAVDTGTLPNAGVGLTNTVDPDETWPAAGDSQSSRDLSAVLGGIDDGADFGYQVLPGDNPNTIGGTIWDDANADGELTDGLGGTPDESGAGLEGVTVDLYEDLNGNGVLDDGEPIVASTVTDADGDYRFPGLPDGNYLVDVTDEAGVLGGAWASEGPDAGDGVSDNNSQRDPYPVSIGGGDTDTTGDFGYYLAGAALGNRIWDDQNGNGLQDPGEPGLQGVAVTLTAVYPNGDATVLTAVSDIDGFYSFPNLLLDEDYNVGNGDADQPEYILSADTGVVGYAPTAVNAGSDTKLDSDNHAGVAPLVVQGADDISVNATDPSLESDAASYDFGYTLLPPGAGLVNGTIYLDSNGDGQLDPSDTVLAGVDVQITDVNGSVTVVTTDENGYFEQPVPAGTTEVDVVDASLPDGVSLTSDANGEGNDPTIVSVPNGGSATDNTGYVLEPGTGLVEGIVYTDENGNGIFEPGIDTPLEGIDVVITDSDGTITTVTTDATGAYSAVVPAGETLVDVDDSDLPPDSVLTTDANGEGSDPTVVTVPDGGSARDNTGYVDDVATGTVTEQVYLESGANPGYQPLEDTPLDGVKVTIETSTGGVYELTTDSDGFLSQTVPAGATVIDIDDTTLPVGAEIDSLILDDTFLSTDPTTVTVPDGGTAADETGYVLSEGTGVVEGVVYIDNDGDGQYDPAIDTPLVGVEVVITDSLGFVTTVTTDENGYYFDTVPTGDTVVDVNDADLPADATLTIGSSDPTTVSVPEGGIGRDDTGYVLPPETSLIGDRVWHDTDRDGIQDPEEPGIFNVRVDLSGTNSDGETVTESTFTDGSGLYAFPGLLAGDYTVTFTAPSGYSFTDPDQTGDLTDLADSFDSDADPISGAAPTVTLTGDDRTIDAGLYLTNGDDPARISDRVWYDTNSNGAQDIGETGIAGVLVELYDGTGAFIGDTLTDGTGLYEFAGLPAGDYQVQFELPAGYSRSDQYIGGATSPTDSNTDSDADPSGRTDTFTVAAGDDIVEVDAGMFIDPDGPGGNPPQPPASISDFVWYDTNNDGIQDDGEPGIPGAVVNLKDDQGNLLATVQTDANGNYSFNGLNAGDYQVEFELPAGYDSYSPPGVGNDPSVDSDPDQTNGIALVSLAVGEVNTDIDAGMYLAGLDPIEIGDYVWLDENDNQQPDDDEQLNNVDVVLYDLFGVELTRVTTVTSSPQSNYLFSGIVQGSYRVAIDTGTLPASSVQIADPDTVLDDETELLDLTATNLDVDFGYQLSVPDITPIITATPNVMTGPTNFNITVRIRELNNAATGGLITVFIPKDSRWVLSEPYDETATQIGSVTVNNADWDYEDDGTRHVFTTTLTIDAGAASTFGIKAAWDAGQTQGKYTITSQIIAGSGGENRIDNNVDAEVLDYFIN